VTRVASVRDCDIPGAAGSLRVRHYAPYTAASALKPPLTVFFHGGGFVIGDLDTHDEPCRILCRHAGVHVLSVDYRLAPEHPFPAAVDDACAAFRWAAAHADELGADPARIAVAGDSAGGNLAAVLAATLRTNGPSAQLLIYPATDFTTERPSHRLFGDGLYISRRDLAGFRHNYIDGTGVALDDRRLSPLAASDLSNLAPALAVVAGFDPLRDDGEAYVRALTSAGTRVRTLRFPQLGHGFIHLTGVAPAARRAMRAVATEWRAVLTGGPA
jgi:acetyl esterase